MMRILSNTNFLIFKIEQRFLLAKTLVNKHVVKSMHFCKGSFSYFANCVYICLNVDTCGKSFVERLFFTVQIVHGFNDLI